MQVLASVLTPIFEMCSTCPLSEMVLKVQQQFQHWVSKSRLPVSLGLVSSVLMLLLPLQGV